jgi:hypothetical protein
MGLKRAWFSPGGAAVNSQGCQPLGTWRHLNDAGTRPSLQGLTPLAIDCRPSGAESYRLGSYGFEET